MRCANFSRVKITQARAVHGVRLKAEISLGKQIRSPAKRSMNIHEKNAVCSRTLCVRFDPEILQFIFLGGRGRNRNRALGFRVSVLGKTC